jgi:hypothetical protein
VVAGLGARRGRRGQGRTFADVHAHIEGNRALVHERDGLALAAIAAGPRTAFEVAPEVLDGIPFTPDTAPWLLTEMLAFLTHLQATGRARRIEGEPETWVAIPAEDR